MKISPDYENPKGVMQLPQLRYFHTSYAHNENYKPPTDHVTWLTSEDLTTTGTKLKLQFNPIRDGIKFLPSHVEQLVANATNKFQAICNALSLDSKSVAAQSIKQMFKDCGEKGIKDEIRYCATTLEAMIDFVTNAKKGKYTVASTDDPGKDVLMEYSIQKAHNIGTDDENNLVCHKLNNPYAVFLCHNIKYTDIYHVSLVGADQKKMNALAVCHKDTSTWYPGHLAFQRLNLKPGEKPICHFLSADTLVWL